MPSDPIICILTTIQDLEHHVRTIYGDSKKSFGGSLWIVPCQGLGQGNGAGPQIWAVVSTPVLNYLRSEGYGVAFKTSISGDLIRFVGYAFVNDTDICQTGQDEFTTGEEIATQMQGAMDAWEGGMRATGGAIVLEKSCWYLIDFIWTEGNWSYASEEESPASISVRDLTGQRKVLDRSVPLRGQTHLGSPPCSGRQRDRRI
jgi:hypothetical protein